MNPAPPARSHWPEFGVITSYSIHYTKLYDLLVCDEPTGDLDRHSAEEVLALLQRLNRDYGKTMIMVTHDPKAAEFARRTLHLDKGTLVEQEH